MNFLTFKETLAPLVCFSIHQVCNYFPEFEKTNLTRWKKSGLVVRLRQGWYSFPEYKKDVNFIRLAANKIYKPSYISLQYALAFYGMIPESVVQMTCVSSLKTASFENDWGQFSYQNLKPSLMFGYEQKKIENTLSNGQTFSIALPEKALLDFLYLNPYYKTCENFEALRLDDDFMREELNRDILNQFLKKIDSKALEGRVKKLLELYD